MALKVEQRDDGHRRVLGSVGDRRCPLGCIYCFVENESFVPFMRMDMPSADDIIRQTVKDVDVIQPACDVEIFLIPQALEVLRKLAEYGKPISFATKARITPRMAEQIASINTTLLRAGAILQVAVSISRLEQWREIERHTPSPRQRIETLKMLYEHGIPTTVAIRPILPFVPPAELEQIVDETHRFCYGYLSGPVYLTPELKKYMASLNIPIPSPVIESVPWMPDNVPLEAIHSPELERVVERRAYRYNLPVFKDNVSAVLRLRDRRILTQTVYRAARPSQRSVRTRALATLDERRIVLSNR